ncbi:MAG: flap endonuclease-1 [Candidatus Hodarchaeota archaeon]
MGVKIKQIVEDVITTPKIDNFAGKVIAIDAFNTLYSFLSTIRQYDGTPLMDADGRITSHLSGFFFRNMYLLENRIKPIYIFDGEAPKLKADTVAERIETRSVAKKKAEEARDRGDAVEAKKYAQASSKIEPYMLGEIKELFKLMGIPYLDAPGEGEAQASYMAERKDVHFVASQDYDCLLFGASSLLRNLTQNKERRIRGKTYKIEMQLLKFADVLKHLKITREELVDLGILIGTDFNNGIPGVGQKTGLKLIQEHGSIEAILDAKPDYKDKLSIELVKQVRDIFLNPNVTDNYKFSFNKLEAKELVDFMCKDHGFSKTRIISRYKKYKTVISQKGQKSLDSFFG